MARGFIPVGTVDKIVREAQIPFMIQCQHVGIDTAEPEAAMKRLFALDHDRFLGAARLAQHGLELHRLACEPTVADALKSLGMETPYFCMKPILFFNAKELAKEEFHYKSPAHQDWRSMQGSIDATVIWIALTDITVEMGALEIVPGSHRHGLYDTVEDSWYQHIEALSDDQFVPVPVHKGDALFFSSFLVHRSGDNVSSRVRWSTHFRYNNATEPTFIERKFPNPYVIYRPAKEQLFPGFPTRAELDKTYAT